MYRDSLTHHYQNRVNQVGQFGVHLMLDGYNGVASRLADQLHIKKLLERLPEKLGMHKITEPLVVEVGPQNKKDPGGISGFVMIAESHISFHTFPLRGFVSADIYTCQNELDIDVISAEFKGAFKLQSIDKHYVQRGLRYPQDNIYPDDSCLTGTEAESVGVSYGN